MADKQDEWTPPKGRTDAKGRPELFMHPDIARGTAGYRITRGDADADADNRCPSSGENVGKMIEIWGSDDWHIECPTCGMTWAGGSTVLAEHNRPR